MTAPNTPLESGESHIVPSHKKENAAGRGLREQLMAILKGIDEDELESGHGWWETSTGAEFGAKKFEEVLRFVAQRERAARLDELKRAKRQGYIAGNLMHKVDRRIAALEQEGK